MEICETVLTLLSNKPRCLFPERGETAGQTCATRAGFENDKNDN